MCIRDSDNDVLAGWITAGTATRATGDYGIQYVKLLWQTKEEGDLGEPVMGIVNSETDHSNIVEIKPADGNTNLDPASYAFTAANQCRIYCRVAPGTTGGSGLIAAYDTAVSYTHLDVYKRQSPMCRTCRMLPCPCPYQ